MSNRLLPGLTALLCGAMLTGIVTAGGHESTTLVSPDASGRLQTLVSSGEIDPNGLFFQSLGTNGRQCSTCHVADQGWSFTPEGAQARFHDTRGLDPLFRANDGTNCA